MELVVREYDGAVLVTLDGTHLDIENAALFRREIGTVAQSSRNVVLAFDRIEFMDSSGLGALLSVLRMLSADGGDLRLCGVNPPVAALLRLVRLDQIIQIFESCDEAVRSFAG